jgi:hypothetical protein
MTLGALVVAKGFAVFSPRVDKIQRCLSRSLIIKAPFGLARVLFWPE